MPTLFNKAAPVAAGLAVVANDTGRVLMIQRPFAGDDPNSGKWEFPGGHIEDGERPFAAAWREWLEETGIPMRGGLDANIAIDAYANQWISFDGRYQGFVARIPKESDLQFNCRQDDGDGSGWNVIAWVHPRDMIDHNLRPELLNDIDEVTARIAKHILMYVKKSAPVNRLKSSYFETCNMDDEVYCLHSGQSEGGTSTTESGKKPKRAAPGSQLPTTEKGVGDSIQSAGRWLASKWAALEERYGRKAALTMAVAMLGTLHVPGNVAAVIAVAEGIRGVSGYFQREYPDGLEKTMKPINRLRVQKASTDQVLQAMEQIGSGSEKFTSIADLGRRLGGSPESLHSTLMQLWRGGKITVAAFEGRHGLSEADKKWLWHAQGEILGYVMFKR